LNKLFMALLSIAFLVLPVKGEEDIETFVIRNGLSWGMSMEEVQEIENRKEYVLLEDGNYKGFINDNEQVSVFESRTMFIFIEDKLTMISYELAAETERDFKYLDGALSTKYVRLGENKADDLFNVLNSFDPSRGIMPLGQDVEETSLIVYTDNDTHIYLFKVKDSKTTVYIVYLSDELFNNKEYNLTNL